MNVRNAGSSNAPGNAMAPRTPSSPRAAITVVVFHARGPSPSAGRPRGAQARVGVIEVFTPASSRKTSRLASSPRAWRRNRPRAAFAFGRSRSEACRLFFFCVHHARRSVRQIVTRVQSKPPRSLSSFRVA
ncbi:MAG: hypothetical protein BGO49_27665 [Planctomycetales bacterium 71-10]|nr:MAG: hypothetical protein BGO49_27665 [Planctomycetales bacterium 71-10]